MGQKSEGMYQSGFTYFRPPNYLSRAIHTDNSRVFERTPGENKGAIIVLFAHFGRSTLTYYPC